MYTNNVIHGTINIIQCIIDLLIQLAKGYVSDRAFDVCNLGVQVYGGYGYIKEYPMEQLLRDCRIKPIYEGTNGIQAMDLLGRKLGLNKGKPIMDLMGEIQKTIAAARTNSRTEKFANKVEAAVNKLGEVALLHGTGAGVVEARPPPRLAAVGRHAFRPSITQGKASSSV